MSKYSRIESRTAVLTRDVARVNTAVLDSVFMSKYSRIESRTAVLTRDVARVNTAVLDSIRLYLDIIQD
jgi:hypothetical protein